MEEEEGSNVKHEFGERLPGLHRETMPQTNIREKKSWDGKATNPKPLCGAEQISAHSKQPLILTAEGEEDGVDLQFPQDTEWSRQRHPLTTKRGSESKPGPWLCGKSRDQCSLRLGS